MKKRSGTAKEGYKTDTSYYRVTASTSGGYVAAARLVVNLKGGGWAVINRRSLYASAVFRTDKEAILHAQEIVARQGRDLRIDVEHVSGKSYKKKDRRYKTGKGHLKKGKF